MAGAEVAARVGEVEEVQGEEEEGVDSGEEGEGEGADTRTLTSQE